MSSFGGREPSSRASFRDDWQGNSTIGAWSVLGERLNGRTDCGTIGNFVGLA
jgi:hypothetical protein